MQLEVPGKVDIYRPLAINKTIVKKKPLQFQDGNLMEQRHLDISEMKSVFFSLHAFCFL